MRRFVFILALALAGCGKRGAAPPLELARIGLDVDIYLHPQSDDTEDLLLQAAVRKTLDGAKPDYDRVYVRAAAKVIYLSGAVNSDDKKRKAEELARNTVVTVNDKSVKVGDCSNRISVNPDL